MILLTGYCHNCDKHYGAYVKDIYDETPRHKCEVSA